MEATIIQDMLGEVADKQKEVFFPKHGTLLDIHLAKAGAEVTVKDLKSLQLKGTVLLIDTNAGSKIAIESASVLLFVSRPAATRAGF